MSVEKYKTVGKETKGSIYKDRKSKFFGYVFPVGDKETIRSLLAQLKAENPGARHLCYAWHLGIERIEHRVNDDGEPHNSAGTPILGQIRAFDLTNVLVVVVRYYGGTKLGVGGLINAYRSAARNALGAAQIIEKEVLEIFQLRCGYDMMGKVLHTIDTNSWEIISREMVEKCHLQIGVRIGDVEKFNQIFLGLKNIEISPFGK